MTNPECRSNHRWLVYSHSLVLVPPVSALSVIAASWAPLKSSRQVRRQSVFRNFLVAYCQCFASCHCCHDPFIVRSAQTRPPFTGFTQLAHPSRCSRSTLTTVCFCARVSGSAAPTSIIGSSVVSMVSRRPILQTCNVVAVLKADTASFQHLRSSSL